jgi:DNA-binding response OmpR family regulator
MTGVILVVDDEPTVRALVRDVLEIEGFEVVEAPDGPTALTAVAEHDPALMVLDIMMPGMSGLDVLRTLRREHSGSDLPIILLTAASDDDTTWAGWTAGASVFLPKPFDPNHLLDWVERLIAGGDDDPGGGRSAGAPSDAVPSNRPPEDAVLNEIGELSGNE